MSNSGSEDHAVVPFRIADSKARIRHVFVRDMVTEGVIGIHPHEKRGPQRLRVNLDLSVRDVHPLPADDIRHVVCYEEVVKDTRAIIGRGHVGLVETLAEDIASSILRNDQVIAVRVRVEKLDVLEDVASVGVEIERTSL
jgi:7,8-dihydroneopterin aldolase/epimerase/oxygenase